MRSGGYGEDSYDIAFEDGVASALDTSRIAGGRDVGTVRATMDGRDVTYAFVARAFHPEAGIVDE